MAKRVSFDGVSDEDFKLIEQIAARACRSWNSEPLEMWDFVMDIAACHSKCPLRLEGLLNANDFNFGHDVFGIRTKLNRATGELNDCFLPRYAA